jgi:hypothetical protein
MLFCVISIFLCVVFFVVPPLGRNTFAVQLNNKTIIIINK